MDEVTAVQWLISRSGPILGVDRWLKQGAARTRTFSRRIEGQYGVFELVDRVRSVTVQVRVAQWEAQKWVHWGVSALSAGIQLRLLEEIDKHHVKGTYQYDFFTRPGPEYKPPKAEVLPADRPAALQPAVAVKPRKRRLFL